MASSNSSVSEQDGRYGNSSKQLWKEWDAGYPDQNVDQRPQFSEKDAFTEKKEEGDE